MNHKYNYNVIDDSGKVEKIYYLYLTGFLTFYVTTFVGYLMAFGERKNDRNSVLLSSHYQYQIKIMNINIILNSIALFGVILYVVYELALIVDFYNIDVQDTLKTLMGAFYVYIFATTLITILFYFQSFNGLKKIKNNTYA